MTRNLDLLLYFKRNFFFFKKLFILCVCTCVCVRVHPPRELECPRRPEEGVSLLELELQAVVSHTVWVLGTELRSLGAQPELQASALLHLSNPPGVSRVPLLWWNPSFHRSEADILLNHSDH